MFYLLYRRDKQIIQENNKNNQYLVDKNLKSVNKLQKDRSKYSFTRDSFSSSNQRKVYFAETLNKIIPKFDVTVEKQRLRYSDAGIDWLSVNLSAPPNIDILPNNPTEVFSKSIIQDNEKQVILSLKHLPIKK